jgi:hypothetical protein
MTRVGDTTWFIGGNVVGNPQSMASITVTYDDLISQSWAYCTLEVYDIDDCDNFPASGRYLIHLRILLDIR